MFWWGCWTLLSKLFTILDIIVGEWVNSWDLGFPGDACFFQAQGNVIILKPLCWPTVHGQEKAEKKSDAET